MKVSSKDWMAFYLEDIAKRLSLTNPDSSFWCCPVWWRPKCVSLTVYQRLPIRCDIFCQHVEEFLRGSEWTISTAALLSAKSGKVYINTEKHPETISFPIQRHRPPLNKRIRELQEKGKSGFWLLQQKLWADGKLLGNVAMSVWAGFMLVSKRPLMTGREWYTMRWNAAPTGPSCCRVCAQDGLHTFLQPDKTASGQNRNFTKAKGGKSLRGFFSCV